VFLIPLLFAVFLLSVTICIRWAVVNPATLSVKNGIVLSSLKSHANPSLSDFSSLVIKHISVLDVPVEYENTLVRSPNQVFIQLQRPSDVWVRLVGGNRYAMRENCWVFIFKRLTEAIFGHFSEAKRMFKNPRGGFSIVLKRQDNIYSFLAKTGFLIGVFPQQNPRTLGIYDGLSVQQRSISVRFGGLYSAPQIQNLKPANGDYESCKNNKSVIPSVFVRFNDEWGGGNPYKMPVVIGCYFLTLALIPIGGIVSDGGRRWFGRFLMGGGLLCAGSAPLFWGVRGLLTHKTTARTAAVKHHFIKILYHKNTS
jgi:hypothetical protein